MENKHWDAHQQALIKNNIVIAVLAFQEHNDTDMQQTFSKFDHDEVVDLCQVQKDAFIGSSWDGTNFNIQPFPSWDLNSSFQWEAPVAMPTDGKSYYWDEPTKSWVEVPADMVTA